MRIGLALSGGGVRALVFHIGVLARLAKGGLLEQVTFISTVSGGSLAIGLIYCIADLTWPSSARYFPFIVDSIRERLTSSTVQWSYMWRSLVYPWRLFRGRAHILGRVIANQWGISGDISDLPAEPRWVINSTCYETGKNWRFSKQRMGDYQTHYVMSPSFPLTDAIAASAAVPGLIGPLKIPTQNQDWHQFSADEITTSSLRKRPFFPYYHLWDGGVYDNLGVEALFKPAGGLRSGIDFLIVCDASRPLGLETRSLSDNFRPGHRAVRLVDIATDQVRALRSRSIVSYLQQNPNSGVYFRMGNTASKIYQQAGKNCPTNYELSETDARKASNMETTLRRITKEEFRALFCHGFEVADATLGAYHSDKFAPSNVSEN